MELLRTVRIPGQLILIQNDFDLILINLFNQIIHIFPRVKFYYIPIKPSISHWDKWELMNQTNHKILTLSKWNTALYYVDTATPMLQLEGIHNQELFVDDELHLNTAGYSLWSQILKNRIDHRFNPK